MSMLSPGRGAEDVPRVPNLQDELHLLVLGRGILGRCLPWDLLVGVHRGELVPNRSRQQEHDATKQEVDERNQGDLLIDRFLSGVASAAIDCSHWSRYSAGMF